MLSHFRKPQQSDPNPRISTTHPNNRSPSDRRTTDDLHRRILHQQWVPGTTQSNQAAEIAAVLAALQAVNPFTPIKIVTDLKYVIKGLTTHLEQWEDSGWIGISNTDLFKATVYHLRRRPAPTTFQWAKGHEGNIGNEQADKLALSGTRRSEPDILDTYVPKNFDLQGAKLSKITQSLAYKAITKNAHLAYNRTTHGLLDITRFAIESLSHQLETDEAIWKSCRQKDITKKIQMYLYKTLNNTYRIGEFWSQIPTFEHRSFCQSCRGETESMEHILTLLERRSGTSQNRLGPEKGHSRLLRILISELAHLIWTLRCERVIRETTHSDDHITKRWATAIEKQLQTDRVITINKIKNTWCDVILSTQPTYHDDWIINLEVLVGIKLPRPSQTEATR
ncbi:RnaseH-domain-containing protein [Suillus occidentalis]|nr:RnaseH-domain-containing protein [Suillus occidentalis]